MGCLLQDVCGNRVEAQQSHLDSLGLGVAASIKEDGEASQMDELQASLQVSLLGSDDPLSRPVVLKRACKSCCYHVMQTECSSLLCASGATPSL